VVLGIQLAAVSISGISGIVKPSEKVCLPPIQPWRSCTSENTTIRSAVLHIRLVSMDFHPFNPGDTTNINRLSTTLASQK